MSKRSYQGLTALAVAENPVHSVTPDMPVAEACRLVAEQGLAGLLVLIDGTLGGVITRVRFNRLHLAADLSLDKLMSNNFIEVQPTSRVTDLVTLIDQDPERILLVRGPEGEYAGIITAGTLVTRLGEQLEKVECELEAVLDTVNEAITIIDRTETVIGWNQRAQKLYNIQPEEIIGKKIGQFFDNLVVTKACKEQRKVRDSYHQPGYGTHVLINASPIIAGGQVIGSVSSERDITETVYLHRELSKASSQVRQLEKEIFKMNGEKDPFYKIKGNSKKLLETINMARRVATTNAAVLIRGESGTGKELFAEAIHQQSSRRANPFIVINCGAIPPTLFESELFGYQAGAFTGADRKGKPGKFELANGGTIFLDEIGELQPEMQVKLLRVLQNKMFYRVGGSEPIHVDVRVIAATHRDLEEMIARGSFREDLYYRLNVVSLEIPALKDRKEDIPELVNLFVQEFALLHGRGNLKIGTDVISALLNYSWPGNIRELRNVVERLVILADGDLVRKEHLPESIRLCRQQPKLESLGTSLVEETERTERQLILKTLDEVGGNKSRAAKVLGIPRSTLYYKMKILGIT